MTDEINRIELPLKIKSSSHVIIDASETVVVRIETDDGAVGLGEVMTLEDCPTKIADDA